MIVKIMVKRELFYSESLTIGFSALFILYAALFVVLLVLGGRINVNKEHITRVSLEEWAKMKGQTDWARLDAMTEEEIEQNALNDPDNQPLTDEFWDRAEVIFPEANVMVKR
jgi:hypothetical protein